MVVVRNELFDIRRWLTPVAANATIYLPNSNNNIDTRGKYRWKCVANKKRKRRRKTENTENEIEVWLTHHCRHDVDVDVVDGAKSQE